MPWKGVLTIYWMANIGGAEFPICNVLSAWFAGPSNHNLPKIGKSVQQVCPTLQRNGEESCSNSEGTISKNSWILSKCAQQNYNSWRRSCGDGSGIIGNIVTVLGVRGSKIVSNSVQI